MRSIGLSGWVLVAACGRAPVVDAGTPGPIAFTADGVDVPEAALDALIRRIPRQQARPLDEDHRTTDFVEHVALTQALYRRAEQASLTTDPEVQAALEMARREFLASEYLRWQSRRVVTPAFVAHRYEQMSEFAIPQVRVRHLLLSADADPDALRARLAAGTPFEDLAREVSQDPSTRDAGGDLGWLDQSVARAAFGADVAEATAGTLLGPLAAAGGQHLVWVEARRDRIPLSEVEAGLTAELLTQEVERLADEARADLTIERR